jgi:hypothetical protein
MKYEMNEYSSLIFFTNLDHYAPLITNRKFAVSRADEVKFTIYLILSSALGPGVHSASNRNEYRKYRNNNVSGSKVRPVRGADNLTAIYEPIVQTMWDS